MGVLYVFSPMSCLLSCLLLCARLLLRLHLLLSRFRGGLCVEVLEPAPLSVVK